MVKASYTIRSTQELLRSIHNKSKAKKNIIPQIQYNESDDEDEEGGDIVHLSDLIDIHALQQTPEENHFIGEAGILSAAKAQ